MIDTYRKRKVLGKEVILDESPMWHRLAGNPVQPEVTGLTRGIVSAGLTGIVNAVIIIVPIDQDTKVQLLATLNPAITLGSYIVYGWFDRLLGKWDGDTNEATSKPESNDPEY